MILDRINRLAVVKELRKDPGAWMLSTLVLTAIIFGIYEALKR